MSSTKNVSAAVVREWLRSDAGQTALKAAGVTTTVGKRGRHKPEQVAVFQRAHKGKRYETASDAEKPETEVPGVVSIDKAGRMQRRTVVIKTAEARALLGHEAHKRGRFNKNDLALALSAQNADAVADQFTKTV